MPLTITATVPVYRVKKYIVGCLEALAAQGRPPDEILVVDDGSDDGSADLASAWIRAQGGAARIVFHGVNRGLAQARNTALAEARGDWVASVDTDALADPGWLGALEAAALADPGLSGVGGRLLEAYREAPGDAWRALHLAQHWGEDPVANPPFLYGSGTLYRRDHLLAVGGYDASLRTNYEDVDVCRRLYAAGRRLAYVPGALAFHQRRDTPSTVLETAWRWIKPNAELGGRYRGPDTYRPYLGFLAGQALRHLGQDRGAGSPWPVLRLSLALLPYCILKDLELMGQRGGLDSEAVRQTGLGLAALVRASWGRARLEDAPGPEFWPTIEAAAEPRELSLDEAGFRGLCGALPKGDAALWAGFLGPWNECLLAGLAPRPALKVA